MATVTVQPKGDFWYTVISYKDAEGKWKNKMQTTKLPLKGNKKKAEKIAAERLALFEEPTPIDDDDILLEDYLKFHWLPYVKGTVERTTYDGYESAVRAVLVPYFKGKKIRLRSFSLSDAQTFYDEISHIRSGIKQQELKATTIRRYHAVLHGALKHAVKRGLIPYNPTENVDLPKKAQVVHSTYTEEELKTLRKLIENEDIGPLIIFDSVYGTRRSETCGLRWKSVDFENNLITINHTVVAVKGEDGKVILKRDRTKNTSSYRTFPMSDEIRALLLYLKDQQAANRELFGRGYNMKDSEYVFVDALGNLIKPDYLTRKYTRLRDQYGLPHVTLHEIRHTVATLLIKHGTQMKYVQEYLGHSNFSTTANIYTHVDVGDAMNQAMTTMTDIIGVSKEGNEKGSTNRQSQNGVEGI